jgi:hypothetical protein
MFGDRSSRVSKRRGAGTVQNSSLGLSLVPLFRMVFSISSVVSRASLASNLMVAKLPHQLRINIWRRVDACITIASALFRQQLPLNTLGG